MIDDITIHLSSSWNFASMNDIIKTCNLTVKFSNFTSNRKIYEEFLSRENFFLFYLSVLKSNFRVFFFFEFQNMVKGCNKMKNKVELQVKITKHVALLG